MIIFNPKAFSTVKWCFLIQNHLPIHFTLQTQLIVPTHSLWDHWIRFQLSKAAIKILFQVPKDRKNDFQFNVLRNYEDYFITKQNVENTRTYQIQIKYVQRCMSMLWWRKKKIVESPSSAFYHVKISSIIIIVVVASFIYHYYFLLHRAYQIKCKQIRTMKWDSV